VVDIRSENPTTKIAWTIFNIDTNMLSNKYQMILILIFKFKINGQMLLGLLIGTSETPVRDLVLLSMVRLKLKVYYHYSKMKNGDFNCAVNGIYYFYTI